MKKTLSLILALVVLLIAFPITSAQAAPLPPDVEIYESPLPVTVHVNGNFLASDVGPQVDNGRTLIPLRAAAEALDSRVVWDNESQIATIYSDENTLKFKQNGYTFTKNGQELNLDVPLKIESGRIMIPLRAFSEALGVPVTWNDEYRAVSIGEEKKFQPSINGYSYKVSTIFQKLKPTPSADHYYAGTWMTPEDRTIFIHPLSDGRYKVYRAIIFDLYEYGAIINLLEGIGSIDGDWLIVSDIGGCLYAYGPGHGPEHPTTAYYYLEADKITEAAIDDHYFGNGIPISQERPFVFSRIK